MMDQKARSIRRRHSLTPEGLLRSIYHRCLVDEFRRRHIPFHSELMIELNDKELQLGAGLGYDFLIEDILVVEITAAGGIIP